MVTVMGAEGGSIGARFGPQARASDRGSGTVLALAVMTVVVFGAVLGLAKAQEVIAVHQATSAADLAALAGAQAKVDPCGRASGVATANGLALIGCAVEGTDVVVEVVRPMPSMPARLLRSFGLPVPPIRAAARAGQPASN